MSAYDYWAQQEDALPDYTPPVQYQPTNVQYTEPCDEDVTLTDEEDGLFMELNFGNYVVVVLFAVTICVDYLL